MKIRIMFTIVILLSVISCGKNEVENKKELQYKVAFNVCKDKWNANDTMKNSALITVQLQFKKIDQLSLAPTDYKSAIDLLCKVDAEKAVSIQKSNGNDSKFD
jgi:hypothetical protein